MNYTGSLGLFPLGYIQPGQFDNPPSTWSASAGAVFSLASGAAKARDVFPSCTATFHLAVASNVGLPKSAGAAFSFSSSSSEIRDVTGSVISTFSLTAGSSKNRDFGASAGSTFTVSSSSVATTGAYLVVSAGANFNLGAASSKNRAFGASAGSTFTVAASSAVVPAGYVFVSAGAHWYLWAKSKSRTDKVYVSAGASIKLATTAFGQFLLNRAVSAVAAFQLSTDASCGKYGPVIVSAGATFLGSAQSSKIMDKIVASGAQFRMASSSSEARDIYVACTTRWNSGTSTRTSNLKSVSTNNHVVLAAAATCYLGGSEAKARFRLKASATASTRLPWRKHALVLPPGGNIPHS